MLSERAIEMQKDIYVCFVDYKKASDNVRHAQSLQDLAETGLDTKDLCLLLELYWKQSATIRIKENSGRSIRILKGARQGCVTSPDFFNLYADKILSHLEDHGYEGISVAGRNLNNLCYVDDMTLVADSESKLQKLLDVVVQESGNRGLKVNIKKTFSMVISKAKVPPKCSIFVNGKKVQQVNSFSCLGSLVTSDGKSEQDIKQRIE